MKTFTVHDLDPEIRAAIVEIIRETPDSLEAIPKVQRLLRPHLNDDRAAHRSAHYLHYSIKYQGALNVPVPERG